MAENALPEMAVKDQRVDAPAVKPSDPTALPVSTNSATEISAKDEIPEKASSNPEARSNTHTLLETSSQRVAYLKHFKLSSLLQERFTNFQANLRLIGSRLFEAPLVNTCIRYMDDFVDASGFVVRRLQRVVEPDTGCLNTCVYLQHYSTCPLVQKYSYRSSESEDTIGEKDFKETTEEVPSKESPECEEPKPDTSTSEQENNAETVQLMATDASVPQGSCAMLFYLAFTWLVLYPVNAVVALLNLLRSLTHDLHDYCRLPSGYATIVGRRIVSPRRTIHSRLLSRTKTMLNEVANLTAGERSMPFKLSLDSQLSTLRAEPVFETRKANFKRKFSLADDSIFSGYDDYDEDYELDSPLETSSTDYEDSITISENNLSIHEEDGFLALKEKSNPPEKENKSDNPNVPAPFKLRPLEIEESEC